MLGARRCGFGRCGGEAGIVSVIVVVEEEGEEEEEAAVVVRKRREVRRVVRSGRCIFRLFDWVVVVVVAVASYC